MASDSKNSEGIGKGCLFGMAIGVGCSFAFVSYHVSDKPLSGALLTGFVIALLYPVVAAAVVRICEELRNWAFPDTAHAGEPWDVDTKAWIGALWPLSLLYWTVISPFFAIINRLFR